MNCDLNEYKKKFIKEIKIFNEYLGVNSKYLFYSCICDIIEFFFFVMFIFVVLVIILLLKGIYFCVIFNKSI